ncbi:ubiquinol-cytochrome c reductase complex 7.3 kda protein-like protein [Clathrospora elynae]|uniref:Complex III subunit 9 n=1 Tax=Clathrospora elynae TaxID=706981 RepID=A0A6A5T0T9_9PLEO|nr:ubiquinol-cytochrome c reductase complex 7.3 kda protein-like protein [Clathrospora elynae]
MSGMLGTVYNAVLRSNTTMLFTVFGAAFGMQLYVTTSQTRICRRGNTDTEQQGVRHRLGEDLEQHQQGRT